MPMTDYGQWTGAIEEAQNRQREWYKHQTEKEKEFDNAVRNNASDGEIARLRDELRSIQNTIDDYDREIEQYKENALENYVNRDLSNVPGPVPVRAGSNTAKNVAAGPDGGTGNSPVGNTVPSSGVGTTNGVGEAQTTILPDGTKVTKNPDGTTTTVKPDGTTTITDIQGNPINADGTPTTKGSGLKTEPEEQEGENLYDSIAKLCKFHEIEATKMDNGGQLKIDCFFVHKYFISDADTVHFKYDKEVFGLTITNSVTKFGTSANVIINDKAGTLSSIIENQSSFYFVVSIMDIIKSEGDVSDKTLGTIKEEGILYQPWIFEIEKVDVLSGADSNDKLVSIDLVDIISATLKKVSYGNLLLQYPTFLNANHFGELYFTLIDFAGTIIHLNHNKKYHIPKNVYFIADITDSINSIIKETVLADLLIDMTCYAIMNHIYSYAVREIEPPANFQGDKPGNILVPILLHDEFDTVDGSYRKHFNRDKDVEMISKQAYSGKKYSIDAIYVKRGLFAKGIGMPFELAFDKKQSIIYECFNPKLNDDGTLHPDEEDYVFMNGCSTSAFTDVVQISPNNYMSGLLWKNLAIMNDTPSGGANFLIFFNWIFEIYKAMFLNDGENHLSSKLSKKVIPNIEPHFLALQKANLVGDDAQIFAKLNSITIRLKSTDIIKEGLLYVARALKSYIFLNSMATFDTKLSMIRRVGEIIKINNQGIDQNLESIQPPIGGLNALETGFALMYTTQIIHKFQGTKAHDIICASKICQIS